MDDQWCDILHLFTCSARLFMLTRDCIVLIPTQPGGKYCYEVWPPVCFMRRRRRLIGTHIKDLADDLVLTVVPGGRQITVHNAAEHSAGQPKVRHTVSQARAWQKRKGN